MDGCFPVRTLRLRPALFLVALGISLAGSAWALAPTNNGSFPDGQSNMPVEAFLFREFDVNLNSASIYASTTGTVLLQANTGNTQEGAPAGANLCLNAHLMGTKGIVCEHMGDGPLQGDKWYTLTFTSDIQSTTGAYLGADETYAFRTSSFQGGTGFIPPPIIVGSVPRAGTKLPSNAKMRVYWEVGGNGTGSLKTSGIGSVLSLTNVKLYAAQNGRPANDTNLLACAEVGGDPSAPTDCNLSWNSTGAELIITPGKKSPAGTVASTGGTGLVNGNEYVLMVKSGGMGETGVRNEDDIMLMGGDYYVLFTATGADTVGPRVRGTYPTDGATGVDRAIYNISVGFTESIEDGSVSDTTIVLYQDTNTNGVYNDGVDAAVTSFVNFFADRDEALITPTALLGASTRYFLIVTTNVKDIAGNNFDNDRSTGGNQQKIISFVTGTNTNGVAADEAGPRIAFANANNFSIAVTLDEPPQFDKTAASTGTSSNLPFVVNNYRNWTIQSPRGLPVNLADTILEYIPADLTLTFFGLMLAPNQEYLIKGATSTGAVRIKDVTGNLMQTTSSGNLAVGTVQSVANEGGHLGPGGGGGEFDFFTFGTKPIRVMPRTAMAGLTSVYEVEFPADVAIPSGGTIVLTFPTGFEFVDDGGSAECDDVLTMFENSDINGPSVGSVTIASIACALSARTVTVTTGGATTVAGDRIKFLVQGIKNSTVPKDFNTSGYTVDIKTKAVNGSMLETMTSMPFFLSTPGSQFVSGVIFNDNGAGEGGVANDQTKNGTEPGVNGIRVCMGGMMGYTCQNTTSTGAFMFTQLSNGFFHIDIPPISSGSYIGGPFFRDINLMGGSNSTGMNFALRSSDRNITVNITGIPANQDLDVFAFNPMDTQAGGHVVREVLYSAATAEVTMPVTDGTWEIGLGPWMPKDPMMGGGGKMPDMNFMPPRPQQVKVSGAGSYSVTMALQASNRSIKGKVVDGAGNAIQNAFVMARPAGRSDEMAGGGVSQSKSDGTFEVKVVNGVFVIDANIPGMPPSEEKEVTVQNNASEVDNNSTTDVYSLGTLIVNDNDGGADNLILKIAKGDKSISGRVLDESGNAIPYSHVNAQQVDESGSPNGPWMGAPTDSSGNFTIYLRNGRWKVFAFAPGFGQLPSTTVVVEGSSVTGVNLQASNADFGTVEGTVTKGGTAVGGAFVNVWGRTGGNSTVTGSDGTYSIKVQAGTGYTIDGFLPGAGPLSALTNVTVTENATLADQDLSIATPGTIEVTLTGITDAFVDARDSNGRGNGTSANPTAGVYEIWVPAGTYTVRANSPRLGLLQTWTGVAVTAGATTELSMTPPTTYTVSGTVGSTSVLCTNGPSVGFSDVTNGRLVVTTADSSGNYSISLPNGSYNLQAAKPGCIDSAAPSLITVNGAALSSGTNRTLVPADATITGRVTLSATGVTIPTKIIAENTNGTFTFADVDTTLSGGGNNYTLKVTQGTWTIRARTNGYKSDDADVTITSGQTATQNIALAAIAGYTVQDPRSTALTPLRGGIVRDATIGDRFEVNFPSGALGDDTNSASVQTAITTAIVTETPNSVVVGGQGYEITPKDAEGSDIQTLESSDGAAVMITIPYDDADVAAAGVDESEMVLGVWSEEKQQWETLPTTVDTENNTLTAPTTHFSTFAPVGPTGQAAPSGNAPGGSTPGSTSPSGGSGGRRSVVPAEETEALKAAAPVFDPQVVPVEELRSLRSALLLSVGGKDILFRDVPIKSWFAPYVASVIASGIASGYADEQGNPKGEYGPGNSVTYAEIAKMAIVSSGRDGKAGLPENRSARGEWSAKFIKEAESLSFTVYDRTLSVNAAAPRGAVIQTIVEALGISEDDITRLASETASGATASGTTLTESGVLLPIDEQFPVVTFKDVTEDTQYGEAILLAARLGIVSGDTTKSGELLHRFRPEFPINRAEVAKIFTKLIELKFIEK